MKTNYGNQIHSSNVICPPTGTLALGTATQQLAALEAGKIAKSLFTAAGQIPYGTGSGTVDKLATGLANLKLFMNSGATAPEWASGIFLGNFTRDVSAASGDVAYTGVGFLPSALLFWAGIDSAHGFCVGFAGKTIYRYSQTGYWYVSSNSILIGTDSGNQAGNIKTYDSNGFTLTWTKSGSPTGIATVIYLALR